MRKRHEEKTFEPIKSRTMLHDLLHSRPAMLRLKELGTEYAPLIDLLLDLGEDDAVPPSKDIQAQLDLTTTKLKRWIEGLYQDFLQAITSSADTLQFHQVEHVFRVPGRRDFIMFPCRLPTIPRAGEGIELPFITGVTGDSVYYVHDVTYEYSNEKTTVYISLKAGYYDPYFAHLKAKASFEGVLDYHMEEQMGEYALREYLRDTYSK